MTQRRELDVGLDRCLEDSTYHFAACVKDYFSHHLSNYNKAVLLEGAVTLIFRYIEVNEKSTNNYLEVAVHWTDLFYGVHKVLKN